MQQGQWENDLSLKRGQIGVFSSRKSTILSPFSVYYTVNGDK